MNNIESFLDIKENLIIKQIFVSAIIEWGKCNFRDYPWRNTTSPYLILISEIMLKRTRADQVLPIYDEFIRQYPDVNLLAGANIDDVRKILKPLGLPGRVDQLISIVHELKDKYNSEIPRNESELSALPSIGHYIARAVLCFAYNSHVALVDTNVVRVLGRFFGIETDDRTRRNKKFHELAVLLLNGINPRIYHYALLDFAAIICKHNNPACYSCPIQYQCHYHNCQHEE